MFNIIMSIVMVLSSIVLIYTGFTFNENRVKKDIKDKKSYTKFQRDFGKIIGFTGLILSLVMLVEEKNEMFLGLDFEIIANVACMIFAGEMFFFIYKCFKYL